MRLLRRLRLRLRTLEGSELDRPIRPEIVSDRLGGLLAELVARPEVRVVLEIGSSSGAGSTAALVRGAEPRAARPTIHCIEVAAVRFAQLAARYRDRPWVVCHHASSVPRESFPSHADVERCYRRSARLRRLPLEEVLRWLDQDVAYLRAHGLSSSGIRDVMRAHGIDRFDLVLIDGSEFTGPAELDEVYGARYLVLDDTMTMKNLDNYARLRADPAYRLLEEDPALRNGFAAFERVSDVRVPA
jgi:hypothetical protein